MGRKAAQRGKAPEPKVAVEPEKGGGLRGKPTQTVEKPPTFTWVLCGLRLSRACHARREEGEPPPSPAL